MLDAGAILRSTPSEKDGAAPTYKRGIRFHPPLGFLDCLAVSSGEGVAAIP